MKKRRSPPLWRCMSPKMYLKPRGRLPPGRQGPTGAPLPSSTQSIGMAFLITKMANFLCEMSKFSQDYFIRNVFFFILIAYCHKTQNSIFPCRGGVPKIFLDSDPREQARLATADVQKVLRQNLSPSSSHSKKEDLETKVSKKFENWHYILS